MTNYQLKNYVFQESSHYIAQRCYPNVYVILTKVNVVNTIRAVIGLIINFSFTSLPALYTTVF